MRMHQVVASIATLALSASIAYAGGGTALTYQGRLLDAGEPANGSFNLVFRLWDDPAAGSQIGSTVGFNGLPISDGLFTVQLDFGAAAFDNTDRWLDITIDGVPLAPRQSITRAPYSIQTRGIFVDQDQNVGIGTTTPQRPLHVQDGSAGNVTPWGLSIAVLESGGHGYLSILTPDDSERGILFGGPASNISGGITYNNPVLPDGLQFRTGGNITNMVINTAGNVGIGTLTSIAKLHVEGDDFGIWATSAPSNGLTIAVRGDSSGIQGRGVLGSATADSGLNYGVFGRSNSTAGFGVYGTGAFIGVAGLTDNQANGFGVFSFGDFGGTGAKYFIQPHPYDPSKEIRFVCLEGNESGTYFRSSSHLENGRAYIDVPEEFRLVSELDGLTVQVTAMGPNAGLWVESKDLDRIVVVGNGNVEFDYFVNGVRRGFADLELIRENYAYVPQVRDVPYGTQYREGHRQILVENGILNPDFTPNEATAAMMGWTLRDPEPDELSRAASSTKGESK